MSEFINFHLIPGLVLGSIYALGAIGITLTFGILRFANFAHGETMTIGAYFALTLVDVPSMENVSINVKALAGAAHSRSSSPSPSRCSRIGSSTNRSETPSRSSS